MNKVTGALIIGLSILLASSIQAASNGHYRWTDKTGTVQYSDRPPEGVEAEFIQFSGSPTPTRENKDDSATQQPEDEQGQRTLQAMPEKDPKLCEQAKKNLKALEASRIRITEPDGSKHILSEEEKEQQRENARKFIKVYC